MRNRIYRIVRITGKMNQTELSFEELEGWKHGTMNGALGACEIAKTLYGGEWSVLVEEPKTVTVWVSEQRFNKWNKLKNRGVI